MRKICFIIGGVVALLLLTACEVHFGTARYDVPWWVIAVPDVLIVILVWILAGKFISKRKYVCTECGKSFHPKWWAAGVSVHMNSDRLFRCPHCGHKGFCPPSRDSDG